MWLVTVVYTDGMFISYGKFKTKKKAIEYLLEQGYKECGRDGRKLSFEDYVSSTSYAEIIPMDEIKTGDII